MSTRVTRALDHVPAFVARRLRSGARTTRLLRPAINAVVPGGETVVRVRSGLAAGLELPIHPRTEKYYWSGVHERHVQEALAGLLRPGMTLWDVGAHIGFFSLIAARLVTGAGSVQAFEPFAPNRRRLETAIERNRATNVSVHAVALADATGETPFHVSSSSLMGSLLPNGGASTPVRCLRADDAVASIRPPDVVKVDVEGAELAVLRGASRLLASRKPAVLVELTSEDMLAAVRELAPGYWLRRIGSNHWVLRPR